MIATKYGTLYVITYFSLWLNEGFASYMEYGCTSHIEPDTGILDRFVLDSLQYTMENDALHTSHPISVVVHHPDEINEIFDMISYGKGLFSITFVYYILSIQIHKEKKCACFHCIIML